MNPKDKVSEDSTEITDRENSDMSIGNPKKIAVFSDTHCYHEKVQLPECDIAIFAGDCTHRGEKEQLEKFIYWYALQNQCKHKVWIAGNHDLSLDPKFNKETGADRWIESFWDKYKYLNIKGGNLVYLHNKYVEIEGVRIWGSPITPDFYPQYWSFNCPRGEQILQVWEHIPMHCDIVVTHGPVYGTHDYTIGGQRAGCEDLAIAIDTTRPKYHICGHIHEGYGYQEKDGIVYINASICDEKYNPINKPVTFEI